MKRWIVEEAGDRVSKDTDVLYVRRDGDAEWQRTSVRRMIRFGVAHFNCTGCSGPLIAMLTTCPHALAARRAHMQGKIKKKAKT